MAKTMTLKVRIVDHDHIDVERHNEIIDSVQALTNELKVKRLTTTWIK